MKLNGIYCCIPWLYSMYTPVQLVHCWEFLFILLSKLPFYKTLAKHFQTPSTPFPGSDNLTPTQLDESTCVLLAKVAEKIASDLEDLLQKVIFCLFLQHFSFPLTPHFVFLSF